MRRRGWQFLFLMGLGLIVAAAALYVLHYAVFRDLRHIAIYGLGDLAFLPIEVLLVTLIVHELLNVREKRTLLEKLNMLIGAFFSEVGTKLLALISDFDPRLEEIRADLVAVSDQPHAEFAEARRRLRYTSDSVVKRPPK